MLIAIMGDTFEQITENRLVNATKAKLELLNDLTAVIEEDVGSNNDQNRFLFSVQPEIDD